MQKRGQLAIFVIIAIVIVAAVLVYYFVFQDKILEGSKESFKVDTSLITNQIQACVEKLNVDGVKLAGLQGGYATKPDRYLETNFSYISYGMYKGANVLLPKTNISDEISKYIEINLPFCIDTSNLVGMTVSFEDAVAKTEIKDEKVSTNVNYPFSATFQGKTSRSNKQYAASYDVSLGKSYDVAQKIISEELRNPKYINFSYFSQFDYDISILHEGNDLVYSIKDYNNKTGGFVFRFANKAE